MIRFLQTPGPIKKAVLGSMLLVIAAAMVITLVPGGFDFFTASGGGGRGTLAKVAGQDVTTYEVEQLARRIGRQQFPRGFPDQFLPYLMQNAANSLIMQRAAMAEAERMGLRVSDAELRDELHQGQFGMALFPGGTFVGPEAYEDFVAQNFSMSKTQFEQMLKSELVIRKLRAAIESGAVVSDDDVKREFQKQNTKVKLQYAVLTTEDLAKQVHATDAELKAFYEKNKARYANSIPEKRRAKYVLISQAEMLTRAKTQLKPEELQAYYRQHQDDYKVPERAKASHILIKTPPPGPDGKVDPKGADAAKAKAESILKQLRAGANFAELAKKESQDTGSAKMGGSLGGWYERGRSGFVAEFEQAMYAQPVGQVGDLVKSVFGYHIIRVDAREPAHVKPFDEVKDEIATALVKQKAASDADALAAKVQSQARTGGLEEAARSNGLQVVTTDWFCRTDSLPGLGLAPEFTNAAFAANKNAAPDNVKLQPGPAVFVVTDIQPARTPTFDEIRAKVESDYRQERAAEMLAQTTQELADRAHAEHSLTK